MGSTLLRVISALKGPHQLMAILLYGSGLRLMECARLRVKDIDPSASSGHTLPSIRTTMIYTHVLNRGRLAVRSPLD